jgi:hypothetical protein
MLLCEYVKNMPCNASVNNCAVVAINYSYSYSYWFYDEIIFRRRTREHWKRKGRKLKRKRNIHSMNDKIDKIFDSRMSEI